VWQVVKATPCKGQKRARDVAATPKSLSPLLLSPPRPPPACRLLHRDAPVLLPVSPSFVLHTAAPRMPPPAHTTP